MRIALLGDFSGRRNRKIHSAPRPVEIDPENFEDVMERMGVALEFPGAAAIEFRELDDFHPDQLYATLPLFQPVRDLKQELSKPQAVRPQAAPKPEPPPLSSSGSLLDQIAAWSTAPAPAPVSARDESVWDQAIRGIVAKHAIPAADPKQQEMVATVEGVASAQMRAILHHPDFQAIEAAWRSVFFLFQQLETGVDLRIFLIDYSRDEFMADEGALAKALGDEEWALIVGLYTFSPNAHDCARLARFGASIRSTFLAGADLKLFGCESVAETPDPDDWNYRLSSEEEAAWLQLRASAGAPRIGLATPRFLLRLPFGKKTSAIDSFDFEEVSSPPAHEDYLWGNPAVACAAMIVQESNHIGGMPVHVHSPGEATPQAEIWMGERLASEMIDHGVMPLASVKHSDRIQLVRAQSLAGQAFDRPW